MALFARNVLTEYVAIGVNLGLGLVMLPFNIAHLGQSTYGLWVLAASVTSYFSLLDMGYGSAQVKFAAQYRALRDGKAINEIASSIFFLFLGIALLAYGVAAVVAWLIDHVFRLAPEQARVGRYVLLIVSINVCATFPFSVFGGIVNGFQRYYVNHLIDVATSISVAIANVIVLLSGGGIVMLVSVTTGLRLLALLAYRQSAHRAFPALSVRWGHVRRARLREVTGFSIFLLVIDLAAKINLTSDTMVIGAVLSTSAVAVWSVASRMPDTARMLTGVLTGFLFPTIVDHATRNRLDRLRTVLLEGTRISLATVIPLSMVIAILAEPIVLAWVGPRFVAGVPVTAVLAFTVIIRTGHTTGRAVLKGAGRHQFLAAWSVASAVLNLALSIVFVRKFGLIGAAYGTLAAMLAVTVCVLFPASCRRVGLPVSEAIRKSVWPAVWPAVVPGVLLVMARPHIGTNVFLILVGGASAALGYAALFFAFAIKPIERRWYFDRIASALHRPRAAAAVR
jgi:O-antigen/teichoic acid export membrane protein